MEKVTYANLFYNKGYQDSSKTHTTDVKPIEYKGYQIYEYIKGRQWDVVKDGVCVGMFAGMNGAKKEIDEGIICSECGALDGGDDTYKGVCVPCASEKHLAKWEADISAELAIYNERSGTDYDFDGFCFACVDEVNPEHLKDLPQLKHSYDLEINMQYEYNGPLPPPDPQSKIPF